PIADYSRAELSHLMTGRELDTMRYRKGIPQAEEVLRVEGASCGAACEDVAFSLKAGEVLGITGLSDSGRNEVALALAGHQPLSSGHFEISGARVHLDSPADAIARGIGYVPEDRLSEGLFLQKSIYQNEVTLILDRLRGRGGIVDKRKGREAASKISEAMNLNTGNIDLPVSALSGGNQQRVLIGRWLSIEPKLLVLHGPTVGVDVGSKDTIYRAIQAMAERGIGLIIVSDDLPELLQNCDRILVMNRGRLVDELDAATTDENRIYQSMLGSANEAA
ncbi:ATP-binding cassette domain-containing protein, partial [Thioclava sp.]|uniref:ATP-binding cassette domain-containing protein n=1 Tax=Thioclava sp. TaxID=1933450 RepID=UPI003242E340